MKIILILFLCAFTSGCSYGSNLPNEIDVELSLASNTKTIPNIGDADCDSLLLVSNWSENNVKIYDGCSGSFIRNLDGQNLIDGPLGILQAPDGDVLVISETNSRLLKFDLTTLSKGHVVMGDDPITELIESNFISGPSGAVISDDGFIYAASFTQNSVVKINAETWTIVDEILEPDNGLIKGIDAGLVINDGYLYLPGYNSNNIVKLDIKTKERSILVPNGRGGLMTPRSILIQGSKILITAERANAILVFDLVTGNFEEQLVSISRPAGMVQDGSEHILVNTSNVVFRLTNDTKSDTKIVRNGMGGLDSGTFVYRLYKLIP